jgi:hypothetical protein
VTEYLVACGLDVGHEKWKENGGVGYMFCLPEWSEKVLNCYIVIHLVRNPLDAIASAVANFGIRPDHELIRPVGNTWADGWVHWNLLAESAMIRASRRGAKTKRIQIEEFGTYGSAWITSVLDIEPPTVELSKDTNHRNQYRRCKWRELGDSIRDMAMRYGYYQLKGGY